MPSMEGLLRRLRSLTDKRRWHVRRVGRSRVALPAMPPPFIEAYLRYCAQLFENALREHPPPVSVEFGAGAPPWHESGPRLRVEIQWEHTLVKPGGRDSEGAPVGRVPLPDGTGHYLVRLADPARLAAADIVIDYSQPNLENLRLGEQHDGHLARSIHVAPLLSRLDNGPAERPLPLITLFADTSQARRRQFLDQAHSAGLPVRNIKGIYDQTRLDALYHRVGILANLRQTPHHDTLEELRVLPALMRGVVVVSEDVPLRERVPYQEFMVWAEPGRLPETLAQTLPQRRALWLERVHDPRWPALIDTLEHQNRAAVRSALGQAMARKG